ncbi:hypothetical protein U9M48_009488 [Paspalum notatum var. saurae]|uniref:Uncharacterized protein n=1 Tax=Paspalum notatum var. saurae TaxID=547442 RepID=A0AAQ3SRD9_PASNO
MRRNRRSKHQSTSRLKEMTMLAFSNTVLSMSARARKLGKSTLRRKDLTKSIEKDIHCESPHETHE